MRDVGELAGLFLAAFAAATLVPFPSEAALFAYLKAYPERAALAVAVATLGNTAGGMTSYLVGRLVPQKRLDDKAVRVMQRYGAPLTFFGWVPLLGDALCVAAGWLRVSWLASLGFMAAGRLARYIVVAGFA
jgi:membrane protein YqaA with SNARE-associated domain